jgi:hypothetical protein
VPDNLFFPKALSGFEFAVPDLAPQPRAAARLCILTGGAIVRIIPSSDFLSYFRSPATDKKLTQLTVTRSVERGSKMVAAKLARIKAIFVIEIKI